METMQVTPLRWYSSVCFLIQMCYYMTYCVCAVQWFNATWRTVCVVAWLLFLYQLSQYVNAVNPRVASSHMTTVVSAHQMC